MTDRTFYRVALGLPLLVGYVMWKLFTLHSGGHNTMKAFVFWVALLPYTAFAVGLALWSMDQPEKRIRRAILIAPILFGVVECILVWPLTAIVFGAGVFETLIAFLPIVVAVGYVCLALAIVLYYLLRAVGVIKLESHC